MDTLAVKDSYPWQYRYDSGQVRIYSLVVQDEYLGTVWIRDDSTIGQDRTLPEGAYREALRLLGVWI